jgi:hypothetical protein
MNDFLKAFVQGFFEALSLSVYLWFGAFLIFYVLLVLFGLNGWTFILGHLIVFVWGTSKISKLFGK